MKKKLIVCLALVVFTLFGCTACGSEDKHETANLSNVLNETATVLINQNPAPGYGSVGGEWLVFGLSRWGGEVSPSYFEGYYDNVESYVKDCKGVLDTRKYTEYSRVVLALTAIGKDPTNVGGYNLLEPLADFDQTIFQGINGPVYALLALDAGNYDIPKAQSGGTQASREMYVDYILSKETSGGGWSLTGMDVADADATAMALQALAKYGDREDVQEAIDRGVNTLATLQNEHGMYTAYEEESSETIAQVIVALTEVGVDIADKRFVKEGKTLADRLLEFQTEAGLFRHIMAGEGDMMATEQAFYALTAQYLVQQGMPSLFSISAVK